MTSPINKANQANVNQQPMEVHAPRVNRFIEALKKAHARIDVTSGPPIIVYTTIDPAGNIVNLPQIPFYPTGKDVSVTFNRDELEGSLRARVALPQPLQHEAPYEPNTWKEPEGSIDRETAQKAIE